MFGRKWSRRPRPDSHPVHAHLPTKKGRVCAQAGRKCTDELSWSDTTAELTDYFAPFGHAASLPDLRFPHRVQVKSLSWPATVDS